MKIAYPFNEKGVPLETWVKENYDIIKGKRVLYVIRANIDNELGNKVYKFGVAGMDSGEPIGRLNQYIYMYGYNSESNSRQGCKLIALYYTDYNKFVEKRKSAIWKTEKRLKQALKPNIWRINRGDERTSMSLDMMKAYIEREPYHDEETIVRRSNRIDKMVHRRSLRNNLI